MKPRKSLNLNRETLQTLSETMLEGVAGGWADGGTVKKTQALFICERRTFPACIEASKAG